MTNLADNLTKTAEKHPDRPAVRLDDFVLSYAELQDGARRVATLLKDKGVGPGDRVGLVLPNVSPFPVLFYGALAVGAVVVPMNPLLKGREVKYYLEDSGASIVFTWKDMAEEAGKGAEAVGIECVNVDPADFVDLLARHEPTEDVADRDDDDTVVLLYTSGTTGHPKGAELTHANMITNAAVSAETLVELTEDDVVMGCLPLFHCFGLTCGLNASVLTGAVVLRTDVFELIQYTPQTPKVRSIPLLIVPPTINKYYVIDLAEQRSLVEHLVASGQQVYCISWRNPDARHADWGLDTYGQAIIEAMTATEKISRQDQVALLGICSGGMIASMVLAHLAATGDLDRVAAFSLAVTVLDQEQAGLPSALLSHKAAAASTRASAEKGYLDGKVLAEVFAWLRPNDLIWNYWVNNYLLGHAPKAFDILYWNADPVRMTAAMHRDFMDLAINNSLTQPGAATMLGTEVDLGKIDTDTYVVAGIADHLCKWQSCYQTTQLFGGDSKFVLSTSGHIAAMVNPPGNEKASFQTAASNPVDAQEWLSSASKVKGSWWDDYVDWLAERTGPERNKPTRVGSAAYEPICDAPGTYVLDR